MKQTLKRWQDLQIAVFEQRIILVILSAILLFSFGVNQHRVHSLEEDLSKKEFILAPGVTDFALVRPQLIPESYVREYANFLAKTFGSFTSETVKSQLKDLEKYMTPDFRIKFSETTKSLVRKYQTSDVSEVFNPLEVKVTVDEDASGFQAEVLGKLVRLMSGLKVSERRHVMVFTFRASLPTNTTPWALQISDFSRFEESVYLKLKKGN